VIKVGLNPKCAGLGPTRIPFSPRPVPANLRRAYTWRRFRVATRRRTRRPRAAWDRGRAGSAADWPDAVDCPCFRLVSAAASTDDDWALVACCVQLLHDHDATVRTSPHDRNVRLRNHRLTDLGPDFQKILGKILSLA